MDINDTNQEIIKRVKEANELLLNEENSENSSQSEITKLMFEQLLRGLGLGRVY